MNEPTRILTFTGTIGEFMDYIARWSSLTLVDDRNLAWAERYEWDLTASIARHAAGKGLVP